MFSISSIFVVDTVLNFKGYCYGRDGNPTRDALERCIAALDNGKHGLIFPSGCATTSAVLHLLETGDHIVSCTESYGGTRTLFLNEAKAKGIEVDFVDSTELKLVEKAIKSNTKVKFFIFFLKNFLNFINLCFEISVDLDRNSIKSMFKNFRYFRYSQIGSFSSRHGYYFCGR